MDKSNKYMKKPEDYIKKITVHLELVVFWVTAPCSVFHGWIPTFWRILPTPFSGLMCMCVVNGKWKGMR
jgi:hypothetical protein